MKTFERLNLRARLFLVISGLVLVVLLTSAIGFYVIERRLESLEVKMFLEEEAEHVREHLANNNAPSLPPGVVLYTGADAPAALAALEPGSYTDVEFDGQPHDVHVMLWNGQRFHLALAENEIEQMEGRVLVLFSIWVIALTAAAMLLAYRLSARLVGPVSDLAVRVEAMKPTDRGIRLATDFRGEEVERIARAFDQYLERLEGFVEREQSFTSTASHELRTPLAVISGAAEILADANVDANQRKAIERIRRAAAEMHQFIDALLALARDTDGDRYRAETDVAQVVKRAVEEAGPSPKPGVSLQCRCEGSLPVAAPATLVRIVVANLLSNAIRHTERGLVQLVCTSQALEVRDDGEGMTPEVLERVFTRHFSGTTGGSGIGLYLVKRICDHYGWTVHMTSEAGRGTAARVQFPPFDRILTRHSRSSA